MIEVLDIPKEKISCIRNLWEKLNKLHYDDSVYFEEHYEVFTFEERIKLILDFTNDNLKISIVKDGPRYLGYYISSIIGSNGEIDSIYIEDELQGRGIRKNLISNHVQWMKEKNCNRIRVAVSYGHESVKEFYHKLGFYERLIYFELKEE
jgi:diamine N-acetyltransferase